jgi:hypothetical protein
VGGLGLDRDSNGRASRDRHHHDYGTTDCSRPVVGDAHVKVLQEWECLVRDLSEDTAWLGLVDVTANEQHETEMAEVPRDSFPADVWAAMKEGTILTWKIEEADDGKTSSNFALWQRLNWK